MATEKLHQTSGSRSRWQQEWKERGQRHDATTATKRSGDDGVGNDLDGAKGDDDKYDDDSLAGCTEKPTMAHC